MTGFAVRWPVARGVARLVVLAAVLVLPACISTSAGKKEASPADAARFNMQLGISYLRQNNLPAAQEKLERAIDQDPGLATAHSALGVVYERLEDMPRAERQYRRAVSLDADDPDNLNSLAVFLCNTRKQPEEALRIFDRAVAIPLSRKVANRAMLYTNAGVCAKPVDLARAERYLRLALAEDSRFSDALIQLAEVSYEQGDALHARGFLERYFAARPASAGALLLGVRIEQALDDRRAARDYRDRLQREFPASREARRLADEERGRS